ncbi:hypothetical protein JCM8202_001369 [Rhodotorula sphaerocarpa]
MPVGHVRINDPNPNPNDNITFTRVIEGRPDSDMALKILQALAAQFKPIMKDWGFGINSLVEYEWNETFAGRNWNGGEVIEIVLRRRDGRFAPWQFLLYVMCHELAHIREMNHSKYFFQVNSELRAALAKLRASGYTGDGFWSTGRSLIYPQAEIPAAAEELAALTCGGANKKSRGRRRRRPRAAGSKPPRERGSAVQLGTTGRQTAVPRKAGGRVAKKGAFTGTGNLLSDDPAQSTFKRRAQAQKAIEARAAAAEARIAADKRARTAESRVKTEAGPSTDAKPKVDVDLATADSDAEPDTEDDETDAHDVGGGWETDEEDKPAVQLSEEEKRWLAADMRDWETNFADDGEDVKPDTGISTGATPDRSDAGGSRSDGEAAPQASSSGSKRKASSVTPRRPSIEVDDLTPEERAWLEGELAGHDRGGEDEAGAGGKRARVACMAMPVWMGGLPCPASDSETEIIPDSCDEEDEVATRPNATSHVSARPAPARAKKSKAACDPVPSKPPTVRLPKPRIAPPSSPGPRRAENELSGDEVSRLRLL